MSRMNLHLVFLLQLVLVTSLAQAPAVAGATAENASAAVPAAAPKPKPKPKPSLCKIVGFNGMSSVYWNNRMATPASKDIALTIARLKKLIDAKVCKQITQECSLIGREGQSAIFIDKKQNQEKEQGQAGAWHDGPMLTAKDVQILKESKICKMVEPTYSVLNIDGRYAAYVDANRITDLISEETRAEKELDEFLDAVENSSSISGELLNVPMPSALETKVKNIECWLGESLVAQDKNLNLCQKKMKTNQNCEVSMFLHNKSAFDVCLQGFEEPPNHVVTCFKNHSKAQQKESVGACRAKLLPGQVCESDPKIHNNDPLDICIME